MKKIVFLVITVFSIYLIYYFFNKTSLNYLTISDSVMNNTKTNNYSDYLYNKINRDMIKEFNTNFINNSIDNVIQDIRNNRIIQINNNEYYLKKSLRESDLLIISVGMEELNNNYQKYNMTENYAYFNKMYQDIKELIFEIRKYAQEKVIFLGYYNPTNYYDSKVDEFFFDMDIKLNELMLDNNIIYLDLYELIKGNNYKEKNSVYLNDLGMEKISSIIAFYLR